MDGGRVDARHDGAGGKRRHHTGTCGATAMAAARYGSDGRSSFFQASYTLGDALVGHPYWTTDIGTPTGTAAKVGGVYQRLFTRGKVLVNPTTTTRTVALGKSYVDLSGTRRTPISLPPHTSDVLP